ncbi:T-cell surface glycoprotein CD8 alpha chain [Narcine bancroftii]|uniref:T-cell surface glycoprotein CD8 alpha chain n=1 Tax=Narcine bancroftii TaxID=1343680 RepID=UPI00383151FF
MNLVGFLVLVHLAGTAPRQVSPANLVKEGEDTVIDCSLRATEGVYWFFQSENSKLQFLLYINNVGVVKTKHSSRVDSKKSSRSVSLTVKGFTKSDSGKYYCVIMNNMVLEFGNMVARYLEEEKTTPKTTTAPTSTTARAPTTSRETTPCVPTKPALSEAKVCHIFIWAPLAGVAFLLFLALVFVSISFCKRPRRKRCHHQYRKRPIPEDVRRPLNNYH